MSKSLVAYFSTTGTTRKIAETIAEVVGADIYEIEPAEHYSSLDLDWDKQNSRSTIEMQNPNSRPALADTNFDVSSYDTIYLGFPIWWYVAPHIINTFLETYDFAGKTIITFATSGGSGFGDTLSRLRHSAPDSRFIQGRVFQGNIFQDTIATWIKTLDI